MIYHPTIIILISIIGLITSYKRQHIFNYIALLIPVITAILFYNLEKGYINLFNITLLYENTNYTKLIGTAFLLVLFSTNMYVIGQNKKVEIILGNCYGAFAFFCLLAEDFISVFIGVEIMMIFSSTIIFIGGTRSSLRSAKKYFLTHIISSNMILIGVAYLITKNDSLALVPIADLLKNPAYSNTILSIMLVGMIINVASFPFSGWMVNYYPKASPSGFLYLISFTTKISIILLIKLFSGCELLKYVGIIMMLYSSIKVVSEDNLLSLLCYLSIMSMGLMLVGISNGSNTAILATTCYLFIHIIYKSLLSISAATLIDQAGIHNCTKLKQVNSKILIASILTAISIMINIPVISSFYVKSAISHIFMNNYVYFVILFMNFMAIFALPWHKYITSSEHITIKLNIYNKFSLLSMLLAAIFIAIAGRYIPIISNLKTFEEIPLAGMDTVKQSAIIIIALIMAFLWKIQRGATKPINLVELIGALLFYYTSWLEPQNSKEQLREPLSIEKLEKQARLKLKSFHNQQTAIFIVFTIFIILLMVLTTSV